MENGLLDDWLQLDTAAPLLFEKELLPVGKLSKWVDGAKKVFEANITRPFLDNIVSQFSRFKDASIRVPVYKTHKEDPDNKRGQVRDVYIKPNSKGVDSLFGKIEFDNAEAADVGRRNEVSVLVPPKHVDHRKNEYQWPLRHVAITSTPVLAGLDDWKGPVVLAYDSAFIGDDTVELKPLADALSLDFGDADSEGQLELALEGIAALKGELSATKSQLAIALDAAKGEEGEEVVLNFPPVMLKQFESSRSALIDGLSQGESPLFSAAMAKELKAKYCSKEALQLDLSSDSEETEFDRTIAFAKQVAKDRPLAASGRKKISLSQEKDDNPLVALAKEKAEAASKK